MITITGQAFAAGAQVFVAGQAATVGAISSTQITATVPKGNAPGDGDVQVQSGGQTASKTNGFHYLNAALRLDGNDVATMVHNASFDLGGTATLECWVKPATFADTQVIFTKEKNNERKRLMLRQGIPRGNFERGKCGGTLIPTGRWTHIAYVQDGVGTHLYINGFLRGTDPFRRANLFDDTGVPTVGAFGTFGGLNGLVDELRLSRVARYSTTFTPATRLSADADTVFLHHFDEGQGTSSSDASTNNNTLTLSPNPSKQPTWVDEDLAPTLGFLRSWVVPPHVVQRGQSTSVSVFVDNVGTQNVAIQAAQLSFGAGANYANVTRVDAFTSVPAGGRVELRFTLDVLGGATLGADTVDASVTATDSANAAVGLTTASVASSWLLSGWSSLGASVSASLAVPSSAPSLVLDDSGNAIVAWVEKAAPREIFVKRWDGAAWVELGGSATGGGISNDLGDSIEPSVVVGVGVTPTVAWTDAASNQIFLRQWNGAAWVELAGSASGGGVSNTAGVSRRPSLALDASNRPVVAWQENVAGTEQIYLRSWNGAAWVETSGSASGTGVSASAVDSTAPALKLSGNTPTVAWLEVVGASNEAFLARHDGANWVGLGTSKSGTGLSAMGKVSSVDLALDSAGNPQVVWASDANADNRSYVYCAQWTGAAWSGLAGSNTGRGVHGAVVTPATRPRISLHLDKPFVAWETNSNLSMLRFNGGAWTTVLSASEVSGTTGASNRPDLDLDARGRPVLCWEDATANPAATEILAKRSAGPRLYRVEDFTAAPTGFTANGDTALSGGVLRLTPDSSNRRGTYLSTEKVRIERFRARFKFYCGEADGITLAFLRGASPNQLGAGGGGLALQGLDGYAIEVDSWVGNLIGVTNAADMASFGSSFPGNIFRFTSSAILEVEFNSGRAKVYLESQYCARYLALDVTIPGYVPFDGYVGLTGSSGGVSGLHTIDDLSLTVE